MNSMCNYWIYDSRFWYCNIFWTLPICVMLAFKLNFRMLSSVTCSIYEHMCGMLAFRNTHYCSYFRFYAFCFELFTKWTFKNMCSNTLCVLLLVSFIINVSHNFEAFTRHYFIVTQHHHFRKIALHIKMKVMSHQRNHYRVNTNSTAYTY